MSDEELAPLEVVFTAELSRGYGGLGAHLHADAAIARELGFDDLVSWGSLTIHPFVRLIERHLGAVLPAGASLTVALRRPVCAGDRVVYGGRETSVPDARSFELTATSARGVVATAGVRIERTPSSLPQN